MAQIRVKLQWAMDQRLLLPAEQILANLPDSTPLYSEDHRSRPPLANYNVSIQSIQNRCARVLKILNDSAGLESSFRGKGLEQWDNDLLEAYDAFLDALMEHCDDCLKILRCFFPATITSKEFRKLPVIKAYESQIDSYRDHIGRIVNAIKHEQCRLRFTACGNDSIIVPGYYVEGPDDGGKVGPQANVHRFGHTAFSFNRDLRFHVVGILQISDALQKAIVSILQHQPAMNSLPNKGKESLIEEFEIISNLSRCVLRQELAVDWPRLSFRAVSVKEDGLLSVEYPSLSQKPILLTGQVTTVVKTMGDGITKSFSAPF